MTDWQITAKTIYCDAVDDEVTVLVHPDGTTHCTGSSKYTAPNSITLRIIREKRRRLKHPIKCEGLSCSLVRQYKEKILAEETQ